MTFEIPDDGVPVYNESFENGLSEFYGGVKGCIYKCDGDFETDGNTNIKCAVVSRKHVRVVEADAVEDAYERILQYGKDGSLIVNRYENLTDEQRRRDRNMVLYAIKKYNLLEGLHPMSGFVQEKFPSVWDEAIHKS